MCGIAGFTAPGREAEAVLAQMTRALAHRGPDASGIFVDDRVAFGHTRLAIIDLAGGAQPKMASAKTRQLRPSLPKNWIGRSNARSMK